VVKRLEKITFGEMRVAGVRPNFNWEKEARQMAVSA
jgi:hypothetical protein